jgi:hypothetical protein
MVEMDARLADGQGDQGCFVQVVVARAEAQHRYLGVSASHLGASPLCTVHR